MLLRWVVSYATDPLKFIICPEDRLEITGDVSHSALTTIETQTYVFMQEGGRLRQDSALKKNYWKKHWRG